MRQLTDQEARDWCDGRCSGCSAIELYDGPVGANGTATICGECGMKVEIKAYPVPTGTVIRDSRLPAAELLVTQIESYDLAPESQGMIRRLLRSRRAA